MKALAVTLEGLESITQLEIKEILKLKSEVLYKGHISFNVKSEKDLAEFIYRSRSIIRAFLLLDNFNFIDIDDILKNIKDLDFPYLDDTFVVRCERQGSHAFNSQDIERSVGEFIAKKFDISADLDDAKTTIFLDISDDMCFIGIDFCGIKLSKREYRVKLLASSVNPVVAYSMLRISSADVEDSILDPFSRSGEIPIEAVLFFRNIPNCINIKEKLLFNKLFKIEFKDKIKELKKTSIICSDNMQNNLRAAEINAKIAAVNKYINFTRLEIEWLDTKYKEKSVDKIITFPIYPSNNLPEKNVEKIYKEFFYNSEYILKKGGTITLLTPKKELIEKYSNEYKFKKINEVPITMGNSRFYIMIFKK
ncbi:MAG: THUMP domain-containing protein [Nanoarchaeota archaeon]